MDILDNFDHFTELYEQAQTYLHEYDLTEILEFLNDEKKYKKNNIVKDGFKTLLNLINKKNMESEFSFNDVTTIFCGLPVFLLTFKSRELLISKFEDKKYPKSGISGDLSKCFLGLIAYMKVLN